MSPIVQPGLRIVFLGTPEFAALTLPALAGSKHTVSLVITQPGRRQGRGMREVPSPVAIKAQALDLPAATVGRRDHGDLAALVGAARPDVLVVVGWGGRLRPNVLGAPRFAAINLHPSLLPRWRGAAPIERALMAGDSVTGVMVIHVAEQFDTGDIILSRAVAIPATADAGQMRTRLALCGGELLAQALDLLAAGMAPRITQGDVGLLTAAKLTPADEVIDWGQDAVGTVNRVRALAPNPGAHFVCQGQRVIVLRAKAVDFVVGRREAVPGCVLGRQGEVLLVAAGEGTTVALVQVKPAGGREMSGSAYANGRRLAAGDLLREEDEG